MMPPPASVAALIVSALGVPANGVAQATTDWTAIVTQLQTMIRAASVAVSTTDTGTATGAMSGGPGVPVVATGTGTGVIT